MIEKKKEEKKKHYITLKMEVKEYWFDFEEKKTYILMNIGKKLVLVERDIT